MATAASDSARTGAWAPFAERSFLVLWLATLVSNIGTWMHEVGAGWLMTTLSPSPLMVALVQAAAALPMFLFALPAGALADLVDRRRLLIAVSIVAAIVALAFAVAVALDVAGPPLLLVVTVAMGTCAAFTAPAWQSIVPQLVPRPQLPAAIALNSMGINVSRAIGPAIAGVLIVNAGVAWPFVVNALSFLAVILALWWWQPPPRRASTLPAERMAQALRSGVRYVRHSPPLRATLVRATAFFVPASAAWALLPLVARNQLAGDATLYGILLASVGAGAVGGALVMPQLQKRLEVGRLMAAAALLTALAMVGFATATTLVPAVAAALALGCSWIAALSTLNVSVQTALPDWVRARGLAVFVTVFFGSMTAGSIVWGQLAASTSIATALGGAALAMLATTALTRRQRLQGGAGLDLTPSSHWPTPLTETEVEANRGPVLVTIDYVIDPSDRQGFVEAVEALAPARRRGGGFGWGLFEDTAAPGRFREQFFVASWLDHLRQHERVTETDRTLQERANAYHRGPVPPHVAHHLPPAVA